MIAGDRALRLARTLDHARVVIAVDGDTLDGSLRSYCTIMVDDDEGVALWSMTCGHLHHTAAVAKRCERRTARRWRDVVEAPGLREVSPGVVEWAQRVVDGQLLGWTMRGTACALPEDGVVVTHLLGAVRDLAP